MDSQSNNIALSIQNLTEFVESDLPVISLRINALTEKLEIIAFSFSSFGII